MRHPAFRSGMVIEMKRTRRDITQAQYASWWLTAAEAIRPHRKAFVEWLAENVFSCDGPRRRVVVGDAPNLSDRRFSARSASATGHCPQVAERQGFRSLALSCALHLAEICPGTTSCTGMARIDALLRGYQRAEMQP